LRNVDASGGFPQGNPTRKTLILLGFTPYPYGEASYNPTYRFTGLNLHIWDAPLEHSRNFPRLTSYKRKYLLEDDKSSRKCKSFISFVRGNQRCYQIITTEASKLNGEHSLNFLQ
jgi:hypothetical protein